MSDSGWIYFRKKDTMDIQNFIELCKIKVSKGESLKKIGVSQKNSR